jgi:hypothetical protein
MGAIIYDETPAPSDEEIQSFARQLKLPERQWHVVRRLMGRVVVLGARRNGVCDWVLKIGKGERYPRTFDLAIKNATLLDELLTKTHNRWLVTSKPAAWQMQACGEYWVVAHPYVAGEPLAPEHRLSPTETRRLIRQIPTVLKVINTLDSFSNLVPVDENFFGDYVTRVERRVEERLKELVTRDGLSAKAAVALGNRFNAYMDEADLTPHFAHRELTPWHILQRADQKIALIDLETMGFDVPYLEPCVFAMRTWALNASPDAAQAFLDAYQASLAPDDRGGFEYAWRWQGLFAAIRTRRESLNWRERGEAMSFWNLIVDPKISAL